MSVAIKEALSKLDTSNDNHWTADGFPRLDTVKMLMGNPSITRDDLEGASPGFRRPAIGAATAPLKAPVAPVSAPLAAESASVASPVATAPLTRPGNPNKAEIERLTALQKVKSAEVETLRAKRDDIENAIHAAVKEADAVTNQLVELSPPGMNADAIVLYHESQKRLLQERADRINALRNSGINLADLAKLTARAPVDAARMNRKRR